MNLIISPLASDLSTTRLVGVLTEPTRTPNSWCFSRQPLAREVGQRGDDRLVDGGDAMYALRVDNTEGGPRFTFMALPTPITELPTKTYHEPNLLEFEHPVSAIMT